MSEVHTSREIENLEARVTSLEAEIERLRAKCERLVAENNRLVRLCDPFLSSADLKAVDKHCDWVAFGHAFRAMRNSRAALGGDT